MAQDASTQSARAILRGYQMSASKAREVLDLIRGKSAFKAMEILSLTERGAAPVVAKVLRSAVANAANLYGLPPDELYVSVAFADEGSTLKRFRPRARGRAGQIRKRTCHITVIVERLPEDKLRIIREKRRNETVNRRTRRVRGSRRGDVSEEVQEALATVPSTAAPGITPAIETSEPVAESAEIELPESESVADEAVETADASEAEAEDVAPEEEEKS